MNLYDQGLLDTAVGFAAALVLGLLFGFWLERAGFGSSRKLTSIFYFRDWAVLKVMFSAMAVAAIGLQVLAAMGVVEPLQFYVPDTVIGAQAVGGVVFGLGFVIGGFCPGTAAVGLGSGRIDALVFLIGAGIGSMAFAAAAPAISPLRELGASGRSGIPELLGIDPMTGAIGLLVVALLAFVMAHAVEARMRRIPETYES
ncbi:MAG: YeeE/YedE thiosulfate transporter family protein [Planctomycetota bacterium]